MRVRVRGRGRVCACVRVRGCVYACACARVEQRTTGLARFMASTVEEVAAFCRERENSVDPERFVDFYAAKGWNVGNQPMKD